MRRARSLAITLVTLSAAHTLGCWSVHKRENDLDRSPVVNHGAGATVIYPGGNAPMHPGNFHPREAGYGQGVLSQPGAPPNTYAPGAAPSYKPGSAPAPAPAPTSGNYPVPQNAVARNVAVPPPEFGSGNGSASSSGSAAPRGAGVAMLGGTEIEETQHIKINEEPKWLKYIALPFVALAAPIKYGADKMAGDPAPAPTVPRNEHQARPELQTAPAPTDYETTRLQGMERELAQRGATPPPAPSAATPAPVAPGSSFSDELAALRRRANPAPAQPVQPVQPTQPMPPVQPTQAPLPPVSAPPVIAAANPAPPVATPSTGQVDRDGDGRTDHWITRENGAIAREVFDENFDGRPDRTLVYDPASHQVVQLEEDANFDGRSDAFTALRGGQVIGRRVDGNGDGQIDSWSIYRAGVITRLERDANGDGFRDHVAYYQEGRLAREERDDDGDGRTDLISYFDQGERVSRVEEDSNGDGEMDVVSHYENGRLARREVLDASVLSANPPEADPK